MTEIARQKMSEKSHTVRQLIACVLLILLGILGPMTELECALEENKILRILDAEKTARITSLELLLEKLTFQFAALKRMQFGQKSEASNALQSEMFGAQLIEVEAPADALIKPRLTKTSSQPKAAPRITIPKDLPVEETIVDIAESAKVASDGTPLKFMGFDISDKLAINPARFFIRRTKRKKYVHPTEEEFGVVSAPMQQIIDGGIADESVLADVLIKKYDDHLPLNRISEIYLRDGKVNLAKQTLSDWVLACASWLAPLAGAIKMSILQESVIHVDETVLPLLHPVKTINARAWAYVGAASKLVFYEFTTNKKGEHVRATLKHWNPPDGKRYLQADAASNYDALYRERPVLELACWAHARRKFFDIAKLSPAAITAHTAVAKINLLFDIERESSEANETPEQRKVRREKSAAPILKELRSWLENELRELLPKSPTALAIGYSLRHWIALTRYLEDGRTRIDNNAAERALRVVAVGRKNWLFAGSENGGVAAARIYTLIESAKACGLNPRLYLEDVLRRLPSTLNSQIATLLPQNWKPPA